MKQRQWRVGSWSMGLALIAMGLTLILSQSSGLKWLDHVMLWWPLLLVLLGAEVLVYLWRSGQEQPVIKYDLFSMLIVAFFGAVCLLFSAGYATGAVAEIKEAIGSKMMTVEAAPERHELPQSIKRVVLQAEEYLGGPIRVEAGESGRADLFGRCRIAVGSDVGQGEAPQLNIMLYRQVGDTVYLTVNPPDERTGFGLENPRCHVTAVLPESLNVELSTGYNQLLIEGGKLPAKWKRIRPGS